MDPLVLYRLLQVRIDVFVVEQRAAYADIDGRDAEPGAELLWAEDGGELLATLRILQEPDASRIGRVATARSARGRGIAADLMRRAVERCLEMRPTAPILLDAQSHLVDWYARFGFVVEGEPFVEDEIPHRRMRRPVP
ncbi:GNAT family N-acetyltransferase [Labedella phragmitis]|uniref:GNAT family N-acetyltransferase n=2 Tax=Labedella phragmitis TaxID=2498849 RepID=A0A444PTR0_9MICO|nr:GNAT family N-acetyltransferase [Labedella phragmitis]